jgi:6-pyruvoyl-tetrahydropterin synthase
MPDGSFEPPHEHLWNVTAVFQSQRLEPTMGVVVDFVDAGAALEAIMAELEGGDLNRLDEFAGTGPSAEKVAQYLAQRLSARMAGVARLYKVSVTEAPGCVAAFYP